MVHYTICDISSSNTLALHNALQVTVNTQRVIRVLAKTEDFVRAARTATSAVVTRATEERIAKNVRIRSLTYSPNFEVISLIFYSSIGIRPRQPDIFIYSMLVLIACFSRRPLSFRLSFEYNCYN